ALEHQDVLSFVVDVLMLFLPPLRLIYDVGQDQQRLERIERFGGVKRRRRRGRALHEDIGNIFSRAALGEDFLAELEAAAGHGRDFYLRELLLEDFAEDRLGAVRAIDDDLA